MHKSFSNLKVDFFFPCNKQCIYFGKTQRHFLTRATEDLRVSNHIELRIKNVNDSAMFDLIIVS